MPRVLLVALACVTAGCRTEAPRLTAIVGATLIDGNGGAPVPDSVVTVSEGRVRAAGPRSHVPTPAGAGKVDATGLYLVPGLVDLHVHLGTLAGTRFRAEEYSCERVQKNLNAYLYYGVTTVRSVGTERAEGFEVRDAQRAGTAGGAVLFTAGRGFTAPGGHPSQEIGGIARQVSTPEQAASQVRELATQNVDLIKIWVEDRLGQSPKIADHVSKAIIEEASRHKIPVIAHIRTLADTRHLLASGAAGFLHMIRDTEQIPADLIEQLKQRRIVFAPTLVRQELGWLFRDHPELLEDAHSAHTIDPQVLREIRESAPNRQASPIAKAEFDVALRNTRKLALAGVPIGVGSDGGSSIDFPGAMTHREIELLVQAGFPPAEAITAATRNGALALGRLAEFGTIESGKRADLLLVRGDPLGDVRNLRRIERLMREGVWVDRAKLEVR